MNTASQCGFTPQYQGLEAKDAVGWNFEKSLVARDGKIIGRSRSKVAPESPELNDAIRAQLKAKP